MGVDGTKGMNVAKGYPQCKRMLKLEMPINA